MTVTYQTAVAGIVEHRIQELAKYRNWYIRNPLCRGPVWDELRRDDRLEMRALIAIVRRARKT